MKRKVMAMVMIQLHRVCQAMFPPKSCFVPPSTAHEPAMHTPPKAAQVDSDV